MLHFAFITLGSIPASSDLLECDFRRYAGPPPDEFRLYVESATDPDVHDAWVELSIVRSGD